MTASAGAWYRVGTVNVTKNNQTVTGVTTNWQNDVIAIAVGDIFTLDAKTWYEVTAVASDTSITLDRGFEGATGAGQSYAIVRNTSGTILTRIAGQVSVQFNQKQLFLDELRTWLNSTNASEELTDSHGLKQSLKTPAQMVADHDNRLAELDEIHPYPWAMRKVEFEARRAANNEKFAASGFVHFGKAVSPTTGYNKVASGLWTNELTPNVLRLGRVNGEGNSLTNNPQLNIAGMLTNLEYLGTSGSLLGVEIKLPPAEDGTRTCNSATGISVTHATPAIAFASENATNKVVTDRVDMWGFEAFLREINDADPFVYRNSLIQSISSSINGVATVSDNVRPASYFAWYEGDEDSRGKGVNWQTASEASRIKIASDPANNIYFDDATGKFYQWCLRGRSFAGAGNGDWVNIQSENLYLGFGTSSRVLVQGRSDDGLGFSDGTTVNQYRGYNSSSNNHPQVGAFTQHSSDSGKSANGECYFLVCGTVSRLNQGAYHPCLNPSGTRRCLLDIVGGQSSKIWYESDIKIISDKAQAFEVGAFNGSTGYARDTSGYIGSVSGSGRSDGRFYDAIYASGQGGVCRDMRYSAWGLTQEDFADADLSVKSGEYRGRETLKVTTISELTTDGKSSGRYSGHYFEENYLLTLGKGRLDTEEYYFVINASSNDIFDSRLLTPSVLGEVAAGHVYYPIEWGSKVHIYVILCKVTDSPIAYNYSHTEVMGNPANILLCDDLKDGWVGSWNPQPIAASSVSTVELTKPVISLLPNPIVSVDNGESWRDTVPTLDPMTNSIQVGGGATSNENIYLINYKTKGKATKNALNQAVRNLNNVLISDSATQARDLGFALTGNVNTSTSNQAVELSLNQIGIDLATGSLSTSKETKHVDIPFSSPTNSSSAFKALNYNSVESQQGFINYAYTELKHNGTDWGDDGKIHIVDNQSTMLDTNGNTVKVGTARIVETLGWIKNDK